MSLPLGLRAIPTQPELSVIGPLSEVIVYVEQMDAQVRFYRDMLGLTVTHPDNATDYSSEAWVTFETGACTLALHAGGRRRLGADAPKFVFRVADAERTGVALAARGVQVSDTRSPAPGVVVVDCRDPEGNAFSIESSGR
ncbi:Glyoxalase-like domain protein [Posidoniimonas corsicana]|uniref:Glyoxalase-like domain protein n=1 Tax=Posidoniimonas corsicana TaxID=1938618 RepID=A0A5C5VIQ1_9BACT|nr:Glyoxalase-like domain protein [Posidoniimonas corsicana]